MQPTLYMMRDCSPRHQQVDQRMAIKIASYIQYFHTHFLSSVKVWEYDHEDWKRSNQSYDCMSNLPLNQILWSCECSRTLYLVARANGKFMFLKAKKVSGSNSNSRLRLYMADRIDPLICSIMNEHVYSHYIRHTRVIN